MAEQLGFVILHYMTVHDTKECVNSIIKNVGKVPIVIVDNGSKNDTGVELRNFYAASELIYVLCLERNLGFAKGNNEGIKYIREKYNPDFIAVMNNDTMVNYCDFIKIVQQEYEDSQFSVLGPQIITLDGDKRSNPVEYIVDSKKKAKNLLLKRRIKLILCYLHLDFMIHNVGKSIKHLNNYDPEKRYVNVKLHGACWVFSQRYFEHYNCLNDSTFLYFEEDILYLEIMKMSLKSVYNPNLVITHLEDSATNSITRTSHEKNIFVLKNEIISIKLLLRIL